MSGCRIKQESYSARALDRATVRTFFLVWTPALTRDPVENLFYCGLKMLKQWHIPKMSAKKKIIRHPQTFLLTYNLFALEMETSVPAYLKEYCLYISHYFNTDCKITIAQISWPKRSSLYCRLSVSVNALFAVEYNIFSYHKWWLFNQVNSFLGSCMQGKILKWYKW